MCFSQAEKQAIKTGLISSLKLLTIFIFPFLNQLIDDHIPTADSFAVRVQARMGNFYIFMASGVPILNA